MQPLCSFDRPFVFPAETWISPSRLIATRLFGLRSNTCRTRRLLLASWITPSDFWPAPPKVRPHQAESQGFLECGYCLLVLSLPLQRATGKVISQRMVGAGLADSIQSPPAHPSLEQRILSEQLRAEQLRFPVSFQKLIQHRQCTLAVADAYPYLGQLQISNRIIRIQFDGT